MPILELDKMKVQSKWSEIKQQAKKKLADAARWVKENPELTAIGTAGLGMAVKGLKGLVRTYNVRRDTYNKERFIYDRSLGMYLHTKRKLTNKDYVTINRRRQNGERLSDILSDLHILD